MPAILRSLLIAGLLCASLGIVARGVEHVDEKGAQGEQRSLSDALEGLRDAGLDLLFTSAVVLPEMTAPRTVGGKRLIDRARALLAPHGLTVERTTRKGPWVVVAPRKGPANARLEGRVVDPYGRPLAGVTVRSDPGKRTVSGSDGSFAVVHPGGRTTITVDQSDC